ncbi:electron transfer flavoprotein subunit beta/FixA family protein [Ferrimonas marina]|uniref:Electron transfer flavoprotein beta subunit n=1 Tax=Ferrimonas marina TaxID=299255 RepID=A0A1M5VN98_9GAMM|nr:hypothetical protein [Ferrimonas marina]SHH76732.1 electron transfer flavoprotein beta subunit [Ferrimonas marina]
MKLLVAIKAVRPELENVKESDGKAESVLVMDPFSEVALAAALQLKKNSGIVSEVVALTVALESAEPVLRTALALGADRATRVDVQAETPQQATQAMLPVVEQETPQLVLLGKQSSDGDHRQTGAMLATRLSYPFADGVESLTLSPSQAQVVRRTEWHELEQQLTLPAVLSADLRLAEPGFAALPQLLKARRMPIKHRSPAGSLATAPELEQARAEVTRQPQQVADVASLISKLKTEARVL